MIHLYYLYLPIKKPIKDPNRPYVTVITNPVVMIPIGESPRKDSINGRIKVAGSNSVRINNQPTLVSPPPFNNQGIKIKKYIICIITPMIKPFCQLFNLFHPNIIFHLVIIKVYKFFVKNEI